MSAAPAIPDSPPTLESVILALCARGARGAHDLPDRRRRRPIAAARGEGEMGWRAHLQGVRAAAVGLAEAGRLVIYRKGKPVDPRDFRGVYRLGAPNVE